MKTLSKKYQAGSLIALAAAFLSLVFSILYILIDRSDRTFSLVACILMLSGACLTVLLINKKFVFAPLLPSLCYSAAVAFALRSTLPSVSDVWNKVNFIGGNAVVGSVFAGVFLLCAVLSIIACFIGTDNKKE